MRYTIPSLMSSALALSLLAGCSSPASPTDSSGANAEQFMLETFRIMVAGRYEDVAGRFSEPYRKDFIEKHDGSIMAHFEQHIGQWQDSWLKTELVGNEYNRDIWRVKVIPDEGKGKHNGPGMVMDAMIVDGSWQLVLWSNHPRT